MTDKKLYEERVVPALDEMYRQSTNAMGIDRELGWKDILACAVSWRDGRKYIPYFAFYTPKETQDEILTKYTKHLKYTWRWSRRSEVGTEDENWNAYKAELEELNKLTDSISKKEWTKRYNELCKRYDMQYRSRDKEAIQFTVFDVSPNTNEAYVNDLKVLYQWWRDHEFTEAIKDSKEELKIDDRTIDLLHKMREFELNVLKLDK